MMKKECKIFLRCAFIIYILINILGLLKSLDIEALSGIFKFSSLYFSISTVIIFVYVWDRGEEGIAKFGLACMFINLIIDMIQILFVKNISTTSETLLQAIKLGNTVTSMGLTLMSRLALFSLIPNKDSMGSKLVGVTILTYLIHAIISIVYIFVKIDYTSIIGDIDSILVEVSTLAEYGFIVYYLLNKSPNMVAELVDKSIKNVELPQQQTQQAQSTVPQKPVTPPPFGNPTVQNQLQQQPSTQPQITPPPFGNQQTAMQQPQITPPPFGNQQAVMQQPQQPPQQHQYTPNPFK